MKQSWKLLCASLPWLLLLLGVDLFAALLLWLADAQAFRTLALVDVLVSVLAFAAVCAVLIRRKLRQEQLFSDFLNTPDESREARLLEAVSPAEQDAVRLLGAVLREKQQEYALLQTGLRDYEEYAEAWAHEAKTPLSLLTLLLDNHKAELEPKLAFELEFIQSHLHESINQMLYYARLKGGRKDYLFERLELGACIDAVLEDYAPLLAEKQFRLSRLPDCVSVYSDRRGLSFLLGQVVSNAVKYCPNGAELRFSASRRADCVVLRIRDNGIGVPSCDLPYLFEKGFTGDAGTGRKNATGMGLYLAREIANDLNLQLEAASQWHCWFEIQVCFPVVET